MFQPLTPYWPNSYTDVQSYDENGTNYITQLQHTKDESWKAAHKTMINILLFTKVNLSQKLLPNASPKNNTNRASLAVISSHNWTSNAIKFLTFLKFSKFYLICFRCGHLKCTSNFSFLQFPARGWWGWFEKHFSPFHTPVKTFFAMSQESRMVNLNILPRARFENSHTKNYENNKKQ